MELLLQPFFSRNNSGLHFFSNSVIHLVAAKQRNFKFFGVSSHNYFTKGV